MINDLATKHFFLVTKLHNEKWRIAKHCNQQWK